MRGTRSTLIAAIAIGLLAGSGVGTVAQDEDEEAVATGFTGTLVPIPAVTISPGRTKAGYGPYRFTMDVSDPRLDGLVLSVYLDAPPEASNTVDGPVFHQRSYRIEGDEGALVGDGGSVSSERARYGPLDQASAVLTGVGVYQGLSAYLVMEGTDVTPDGVIPVHGAILVAQAEPQLEPAPSAGPRDEAGASLRLQFMLIDMEGMTLTGELQSRRGEQHSFEIVVEDPEILVHRGVRLGAQRPYPLVDRSRG